MEQAIMENVKIPAGYQRVMPYLIIPNAATFLDFTQKVFGAQEKSMSMRDSSHIMHAEILIGESVIMFADSNADYPPQTAGLYICVHDADETYQKALAEGATSVMEPTDKDYGRSAGIQDPCGNVWWITSVK